MTKILILGAHGQIARVATRLLLERTDATLTLYLCKAKRLSALADKDRVSVVEGDVLDTSGIQIKGARLLDAVLAYSGVEPPRRRYSCRRQTDHKMSFIDICHSTPYIITMNASACLT